VSTDTGTGHDAALDALAEVAHDSSLDELVDRRHAHRSSASDYEPDDSEDESGPTGAFSVLRRGIAVMPEVREGVRVSLAFAVVVAAGKLLIPVAIQ
jgi:hypothetical protein